MQRLARRAATALGLAIVIQTAGVIGPASAGWREDMKVLRVGFLVSSNPAADVAHLEPFRAYLEQRISLPVELVPATTTASLIDAESGGRIQYAIQSASGYASTEALCNCVEPLALPAAFDGSRGFYSVLLARADSPVQTLADTDGLRLALSAGDSVAGRLIPQQAFATAEIDPATHFSAIYESPGPVDAVRALLDGRTDLAAAWSSLEGDAASGYSFGALTGMVADGSLSMDQVRIVWQSALIPFGPHVVRTDLPAELKTLLGDALTAMASDAPGVLDAVDASSLGGGGFVAASAADYAAVAALVTNRSTTASQSSSTGVAAGKTDP